VIGRGGPASAVADSVDRRPSRPRWLRAKNWDDHVEDLERMADSPGFLALRDHILELARLRPGDRLLDIGAGTGLLAMAAAPRVAHVSALDVSPAMCRHLARKFDRCGVRNAEVLVNGATDLPLSDGTIDVVVSNYCFHHLSDREKTQALAQISRVLRPGGRLVFADMMFRINLVRRRDRAVITLLVRRMISLGPAGLVRLLKNVTRVLAGRGEHPAGVEWWRDALLGAGFVDVSVRALAHEGGVALARKPE
jgi:SAM-dependent methyltransferase